MKYLKLHLLGIASLAAMSLSGSTITYTLTQDGCSSGCGSAPFGTIMLTDTGAGSTMVTVVETLKAGEGFVKTGAGEALEFNVNNAVTLSGFTAGFAAGPAPASASTFGSFLESVSCTGCGSGASSPLTGPLTFTVTSASGLTINNFIGNTGGFFFASDIIGTTGNTGNVAAKANVVSGVPEPASIMSAFGGFALFGIGAWRRKKAV